LVAIGRFYIINAESVPVNICNSLGLWALSQYRDYF